MTICTGAGPLRGGEGEFIPSSPMLQPVKRRPATRNNTFTETHGYEDDFWAKLYTCTVDTDPSIAAVYARLSKFRRSTANFKNGNSNPSANLNASGSGSTSGKTNVKNRLTYLHPLDRSPSSLGVTVPSDSGFSLALFRVKRLTDAGAGLGVGIYANRQHLFTNATNISSSSENATLIIPTLLPPSSALNNEFNTFPFKVYVFPSITFSSSFSFGIGTPVTPLHIQLCIWAQHLPIRRMLSLLLIITLLVAVKGHHDYESEIDPAATMATTHKLTTYINTIKLMNLSN
ncbi:hypothetical protein EV368DRAFT_77680 [Lentinula lateritia]|nr:hypothetical protein EV368DRAFT_77680 [Lentinula lateritia]